MVILTMSKDLLNQNDCVGNFFKAVLQLYLNE